MKLLLGIGGGPDGFRALSRAIERAAATGDDLTVAVVENPAADPDPDGIEARVRDELRSGGVDATVRIETGDPGGRLVEIAESEGFDAIVIGGGTRSPMGKIDLGDVAQYVVLNATTTVILVR